MPELRASCEPAGEPFELVSRGDFVRGLLRHGAGAGRRPALIVAPALGSHRNAPEVTAWCRALAEAGVSTAAIDLPLQGERASPKLTARLLACANGTARDPGLWREYLRQTASDLAATRAWLVRNERVRPDAIGCIAFEPGAAAALDWAEQQADLRVCRPLTASSDPASVAALLCEPRS